MQRFLLLVVILSVPPAVSAQEEGCDIIPLARATDTRGSTGSVYITGRTEFRCSRGVVFVADNANSVGGLRTLSGNVVFSDPDKTIRTHTLQYEEATGRVVTTGHTTVVDRKAGSILVAPDGLTYWKERPPGQPMARIEVFSGRPQLTVVESKRPAPGKASAGDSVAIPIPADSSAGPIEQGDTTVIHADRMEITGQTLFRGWGRVEIKRGKLDATGEQTVFDDSLGIMDLWGIARIKGETYDVHGDSIRAEVEGDLFREVRVFRNARIDDRDMKVRGERLRIEFDSGAVRRLVALGANPKDESADSLRADVTTEDFQVRGDSIDALAPGQKLERVTAVGHAFGGRLPDSLDLALPELIQRDWLRGDTVHAWFVEAPDSLKARRAQSDSSFDRVLDRLQAVGSPQNPASALYRMRPENADSTSQSEVGYIIARLINAIFRAGEIHNVQATDRVTGIYLQPQRPPGAAPRDPAKASSDTSATARNGKGRQ